jgi:nicotinamidase-related amidase
VIQEARLFHAYLRDSENPIIIKGDHVWSEYFSACGPEVSGRHDSKKILVPSMDDLFRVVVENDRVVFAGEALSHCEKATLDDLADRVAKYDRSMLGKMCVLSDCTSSVVVRDGDGNIIVDYTAAGLAALEKYDTMGMHVVKSTDQIF